MLDHSKHQCYVSTAYLCCFAPGRDEPKTRVSSSTAAKQHSDVLARRDSVSGASVVLDDSAVLVLQLAAATPDEVLPLALITTCGRPEVELCLVGVLTAVGHSFGCWCL